MYCKTYALYICHTINIKTMVLWDVTLLPGTWLPPFCSNILPTHSLPGSLEPWGWGPYNLPQCWYHSTRLQNVIFQKICSLNIHHHQNPKSQTSDSWLSPHVQVYHYHKNWNIVYHQMHWEDDHVLANVHITGTIDCGLFAIYSSTCWEAEEKTSKDFMYHTNNSTNTSIFLLYKNITMLT